MRALLLVALALAVGQLGCARSPSPEPVAPFWPAPGRPVPLQPAPAPSPPSSPSREEVRLWVHEVALGTEFGGDGAICSRWVRPPRVRVLGALPHQSAEVDHVLARLNAVVAPLGLPIVRVPDGASGSLEVHFVALAEMPARAAALGFPYVPNNYGYFWAFWNDAHEIDRAYVLLASDRLVGEQLRHFTFEELTQSLGLANDSPRFVDSVFFSRGSDGGRAVTLSALDEALLRFFYTAVRPGFRRAELDAAFERWWPAR